MPDGDTNETSIAQQFYEAFGGGEGDGDAGDKGGQQAPSSTEGNKGGSGDGGQPASAPESKGGGGAGGDVGKPEGEQKPDPLASLTIEDLLKHPTLSKALHSYADRVANSRIEAEVRRARAETESATRAEEEFKRLDEFFSDLSEEELAREFRQDPSLREQWQRWQARKHEAEAQALGQSAERLALLTQVQGILATIREANFPEEVQAELDPKKFTHLGAPGILEWQKAVTKALAKQEAQRLAESEINERWEAEKTQRLAELDKERPGALRTPGQATGGKPDLMRTPTRRLFEQVFS